MSGIEQGPSEDPPRSVQVMILHAFPIVDAMAWDAYVEAGPVEGEPGLTKIFGVRRQVLTTGSVRYEFRIREWKTKRPFATVTLRMVAAEATLCQVTAGSSMEIPKNYPNDWLDFFQGVLSICIIKDQNHASAFITRTKESEAKFFETVKSAIMPPISPTTLPEGPSNPGRHESYDEDIWAWEQVNTERRPRTEVYEEWNKRQEAHRKVKKPQDSFRKIVHPDWKGRRKAES